MKKKAIVIILVILLITSNFIFKDTFAISDISKYNFYIKENNAYGDEKKIILVDTIDEKTLTKGKIAPGTSGSFEININIQENVIARYKLSFGNFLMELPKNLKFYLDEEEIDLNDFSLMFIQYGTTQTHYFDWEWEYEIDEGDIDDILASEFGEIEFSIILETEYEKLDTRNRENTEKLPRSRRYKNKL